MSRRRDPSTLPSALPCANDAADVIRRVTWNQLLFSAGNALTVGSFFNYFIDGFQPGPFLFSCFLILPESAQSLSVFTRWIVARWRNRKRMWIVSLVAARVMALLIPLALLGTAESRSTTLAFLLACTAAWYLLQGLAHVSLVSWLSDLVPEVRWGRLFARREMANLVVTVAVTLGVGLIRLLALPRLAPTAERWSYAAIFAVGGLLAMSSIVPLWTLPEGTVRTESFGVRTARRASHFVKPSFVWLLASRWWGAFFQGLTQSAFFLYSVRILEVPLESSLALTCCGRGCQFFASWWAGRLSDRSRDRFGLALGLLLAACALPVWLIVTPATWWLLFAAHALWGGFGLVNVCGNSLCLKHSPRSDNTLQFALYDKVSGLIAGLSGLLGGWWLEGMVAGEGGTIPNRLAPLLTELQSAFSLPDVPQPKAALPYLSLIAISFCGRMATPLWLVGVRAEGSGTGGQGPGETE